MGGQEGAGRQEGSRAVRKKSNQENSLDCPVAQPCARACWATTAGYTSMPNKSRDSDMNAGCLAHMMVIVVSTGMTSAGSECDQWGFRIITMSCRWGLIAPGASMRMLMVHAHGACSAVSICNRQLRRTPAHALMHPILAQT